MDSEDLLHTPDLKKIERDGVSILIDPRYPNWIAVNPAGDRLISLCDGTRRAKKIIEQSENLYPEEEVIRFLEGVIDCQIIGTSKFTEEEYRGRDIFLGKGELEELWLYVTNRCNLSCKHCLVKGGEITREELGQNRLKEIIKEAGSLGAKRVFFTGGEPFLRKDIFDLIKYVTNVLGLELVILTNGTLLDKEKIMTLAELPGLIIQVSLEGSTAVINDEIRGEGNYKKTLSALELLSFYKVPTIVTSTATKYNLSDIPRLSELLHEIGLKTHHILWLHNRGRARENRISTSLDELTLLMKNLLKKEIKVDNWESSKSRVFGRRGVKVDGCHAGYSSICVDSNGDVYPCPSLNGDHNFCMGNVEFGLRKVLSDPNPDMSLKDTSVVQVEDCKACEFRFFCGGGCRCQAYFSEEEPDILAKDPYCGVTREMFIESIMSQLNPDGHNSPEILGNMKDFTSDCTGEVSGDVVPFHCTCVQDIGFDMHSPTKARYGEAAKRFETDLCCPTGYTSSDLKGLPEDTISVSYGCGNPSAFADIAGGEHVLDLGSGGGIDSFIAAKKVGRTGQVIGVDMTDEMIDLANRNREKIADDLGFDVVEFRKGYMEDLPVESDSIDLVISNCTINLSPDKKKVFKEIYRVIRRGGRFSISDIVSDKEVPWSLKRDEHLWSGCVSGALTKKDFLQTAEDAGFTDLVLEKEYKWKEVGGVGFYSITLRGRKKQ